MSGPDRLRIKQFLFLPNTNIVDNIKLSVMINEPGDDSTSCLAALPTKSAKEQSVNLISFDKFSSYQKLLPFMAYMLPLLTYHERYRTVDLRILLRMTKPSVISSSLFEENPLVLKESTFLTTIPLRRAVALLCLYCFLDLIVPFVRLVDSKG